MKLRIKRMKAVPFPLLTCFGDKLSENIDKEGQFIFGDILFLLDK